MGCDNPLSRRVGGGWWRQSDEEALLQPSPSRYITLKINAASRRELLAVPGLRTAAPLPGVRVALWQLMQLLKPQTLGRTVVHGRELWGCHQGDVRDEGTHSKQLFWG